MTARWEAGEKADADFKKTPLKQKQINSGAHYIFEFSSFPAFPSIRWTLIIETNHILNPESRTRPHETRPHETQFPNLVKYIFQAVEGRARTVMVASEAIWPT